MTTLYDAWKAGEDITLGGHAKQDHSGSTVGRGVLLVLLVVGLGSVSVMATKLSYLRPALLEVNEPVFAVAWPAWLAILVATTRKASLSPRPNGSAAMGRIRYGFVMLLAATVFAFLTVIAVDQCLLLAVRYGHSEPVEFRSQVTHTGRTRGCSHTFSFANVPLGRETSMCGDKLPLFLPKAGDRLIVQEQVGTMGGTITLVRRDTSDRK